jgi:hypothetical protein
LRFSGLILENILMVFLGSSCRETAKNAIKIISMGKDERKKVVFSQLFRPKVFVIDFPQKVFYGVFELPLLRNAKNAIKKLKKLKKKQKGTYLPDLLAICQIYPRFIFFFLRRPSVPSPKGSRKKKRKRKSDVPTYLPFLRFFEIFRSGFRKYFYGVFRPLMQRNGQKTR